MADESTTSENDFDVAIPVVKTSEPEGLVFGWANLSKNSAGETITDLHGEQIETEDLVKAAHGYVENAIESAVNDMHDGPTFGHPVESLVFRDDVFKALATDPATRVVDETKYAALKALIPDGAWLTVHKLHLDDPVGRDAFDKVCSGERPMLSIEGTATKVAVEA
jgi:hypothetical protein